MTSKKSQLFLMDLIFSFTLLIAALGLFFFYFSNTTQDPDLFEFNRNLMNTFSGTNINSLNNPEVRQMFVENRISNVENSVAQQIAEFYFLNQTGPNPEIHGQLARNLTRAFIGSFVTSPELMFNVSISSDGETWESLYVRENIRVNIEDAPVVSTTSRDIVGFLGMTTPFRYTFRIELWV